MAQDGWQDHNTTTPGSLRNHPLSNSDGEEDFVLVQTPTAGFDITKKAEVCLGDVQLALIRASRTQARVASLAEECLIEAPPGCTGTLSLRQSIPSQYHWLHIRQGDVVQFPAFAYHFTIVEDKSSGILNAQTSTALPRTPETVEKGDQVTMPTDAVQNDDQVGSTHIDQSVAPTDAAQEEVQVQSSMPTVEQTTEPAIEEDSTDDELRDEPQLEHTLEPATPIPLQPVDSQDEDELYSTARDSVRKSVKRPVRSPESPDRNDISIADDGVAETPVKQTTGVNHFKAVNSSPRKHLPIHEKENVMEVQSPLVDRTNVILSQSPSMTRTPAASGKLKRKTTATTMTTVRSKKPRTSTGVSQASTPDQPRSLLLINSKFKTDKKMASWLKNQGYTIINDIPDKETWTNYTCVVGEDELKPSIKLLRSLIAKRTFVTDKWLEDSKCKDILLPLTKYSHPDFIEAPRTARDSIFDGLSILFSPKLHKSYGATWSEVELLLREAGAQGVEHPGSRKWKDNNDTEQKLFVAADQDDATGRNASQAAIFHKDLLSQSILRGELLINDESFKLNA